MVSLGLMALDLSDLRSSDPILAMMAIPFLERICANLVTSEMHSPMPSIWTDPCFFMMTLQRKRPSLRRVDLRTL